MQKQEIIDLIQSLGFQNESSQDIYVKDYREHNYSITIDFQKKKIIYPPPIQIGDETTTNFSHPENFIVLECVERLLRKGYRPDDLYLEKKWSLGRSQKSGKADITIKDNSGNTILIIECKVWGQEYEKEKNRMQANGGQLFSYLQQDRNARYLCLYTSTLLNGSIKYENSIVRIEDDEKLREQFEKGNEDVRLYTNAKTVEELHQVWKENYSCYFHPNGIFEEDVQPYQIDLKPLKVKDLKPLKEGDGGFIHNQFVEILRHNNISDKENAFNKMISLFLCKVVDESKESSEVVDFQWKEGIDNYEDLQDRLQRLYQEGMKEYLKEEIIYFENDYVEKAFKYHKKAVAKDKMTKMLKALKFYTNNEFAFKEVHNEKLFEQNAKVINEVVQLLQPYRIKYSQKQQFLGNLFELLLNDGLKQSEGQFFTPVPITRFIVSSLPIHDFISDRWKKGEVHLLPRVVDYACGSGHFLTEAIDEIQGIIENLNMSRHRGDTRWARDYIFGIEKDYRLARIAKIACFLNGAGDANIIYGDGLESHDQLSESDGFDILIANPPYSIKDFKHHLHLKRNKFDLLPYLSDTASEIETLFVERIEQLLRPGGMAWVILPSSILSNSGIYTRAREVILKNFHVRAIVELSGQTFIATNTNTVILFLQKHINGDNQHFAYRADSIFDEQQFDDAEYHDGHLLRGYCQQIGIDYEHYISLIRRLPTDGLKKSELFVAYQKWFNGLTEINNLKKQASFQKKGGEEIRLELARLFFERVLAKEKEKFYYFCLAYGQQVVIVKAGDKDKEKAFLGYEWSKRRGFEGMKIIGPGKLYDKNNFNNHEKCNSYVRQAFLGKATDTVHESVAGHISTARLIDMMDFSRIEFDKQIGLNGKKTSSIDSIWPVTKLYDHIEITSGQSPNSINYNKEEKGLPFYQGSKDFGEKHLKNSSVWTTEVTKEALENDILMSVRAPVGDVNINPFKKICIGRGLASIRTNKSLNQLFLYYWFKFNPDQIIGNKGLGFDSISRSQIMGIKIPLPPLDIQKKIIEEIETVEQQAVKNRLELEKAIKGSAQIIDGLYNDRKPFVQLDSIVFVKGGKRVPKDQKLLDVKTEFPYIRVTDFENGSVNLSGLKYISQNVFDRISSYIINKDDVYISIAGTIGLVGTIPDELNGKSLTENAAKLVIRDKRLLNTKYLSYCLRADHAQKQIKNRTRALGVPKLALDRIRTIQIPLPSIESQCKIVSDLDQKEQRITELKSRISEAETKKAEIMDKYLK
jgi:type I restriction enzyme M protein